MSSEGGKATVILAAAAGVVAGAAATALVLRSASRSAGAKGPTESADIYESEASARQYMEFHYTPSRDSYVYTNVRAVSESFDFPVRLAQKFKIYLPNRPNLRGLDVGCATGASVFEMSKYFDGGVIGMDYSETFVHLANEVLQSYERGDVVRYTAPTQGAIVEPRELQLPKGVFPERCRFVAGDAMHMLSAEGPLPERPVASRYADVDYWQAAPGETFDGILCLNLIDRVPDPMALLRALPRLLSPGGVLVLADPYSWWEGATARDKWVGGKDGVRSEDAVRDALLEEGLTLCTQPSDEAFLIRDHVRHYQLGFSHCLVFRKK